MCVWPAGVSPRTATSLRKDRVSCQHVFLFCLCVHNYIYVCLCMCVFVCMSTFATGGQRSTRQNCFSCGRSSVTVNQDLTSGPILLHNYVSLTAPSIATPVRPWPEYLTPVSSCTDCVVSAEMTGQITLLSILWIYTTLIWLWCCCHCSVLMFHCHFLYNVCN